MKNSLSITVLALALTACSSNTPEVDYSEENNVEAEVSDIDSNESYPITEQEDQETPVLHDGHHLHTYLGDDGNDYTIVFNTNTTPPTALIESSTTVPQEPLVQTEAWAKGAIYEIDDIKLIAKGGNTAELTIDDRTIKLQSIK